jgi:hypothetical protein
MTLQIDVVLEESSKAPEESWVEMEPIICSPFDDRVFRAVTEAQELYVKNKDYGAAIGNWKNIMDKKENGRVTFFCCKKDYVTGLIAEIRKDDKTSQILTIYCDREEKATDKTLNKICYLIDERDVGQNPEFIANMYDWLLGKFNTSKKQQNPPIKVLVVCGSGLNRSPRVALLLSLMIENGTDYDKAWKALEEKVPVQKKAWDESWKKTFEDTVFFFFVFVTFADKTCKLEKIGSIKKCFMWCFSRARSDQKHIASERNRIGNDKR